MRKMTILNEDYIYLQQKLAEALDEAAYEIREELEEMDQLVESFINSLSEEEKQNYKATPQYINFKNNEELVQYFVENEIENHAIESIRTIKKLNEFTLEESSLLSKYCAKIFKEEPEDEFEEAVLIFGKNNVDIPESDENLFRVIVTEAGIMNAIRIFGMVPGMAGEIKESIKKSNDLQVLKEGLERLRLLDEFTEVILDERLTEQKIQEELMQFLREELSTEEFNSLLNEDVLTEGKILNKIRWKLALFSLRFLKEESINKFLEAYYSDKEGKPTEKSKAVRGMAKKEKLSKMRELANRMSQEEKDKVANNPAAKKLEKSAAVSGIIAGVAGGASVVSGVASSKAAASAAATGNYSRGYYTRIPSDSIDPAVINHNNINPHSKPWSITQATDGRGGYDITSSPQMMKTLSGATSILSVLSSVLFGAMWGGIIIAGISVVKGLRSAVKAQTLRRDEIIKELEKKNKRA